MRAKVQFSLILTALSLVLLPILLAAASETEDRDITGGRIQPILTVDNASFQTHSKDTVRLELYHQIFNFGLSFQKDSDVYVAAYTLSVVVDDGHGHQIKALEQDRTVKVGTYGETTSRFDYRTSQLNINLPPGTYQVHTALRDKQNRVMAADDRKIKLPKYEASLPLSSDIEFLEAADAAPGESTGVFNKNGLILVPSASRIYGGSDTSKLLYYFEIYRGSDSTDEVLLETVIRSQTKGMVYRDTVYVAMAGPLERQVRSVSVADFAPGDYALELYVRGHRNKRFDERTQAFSIAWSQDRLLRYDFKTAIDQLSLIANSKELGKIKKAKTLEERIAAFNEFWLSRDPTQGTAENESKREFYRRVNYANRAFRHLSRDGWRTDRGRIYIQFGEPDQVDDYPMSPSYPPYQIWHYYTQGSYKRFLFVDENDDGDYRLQYPYDGLHQRPDF